MSLINLLGTGYAIAEMAELNRRSKQLQPELRQKIVTEGGEVQSVSSLNARMILHSPFPRHLLSGGPLTGPRPVLLRIRCRYPTDSGSWFVCAPVDDDVQWTWMGDSSDDLPAHRENGAIKNDIIVLPFIVGAAFYVALAAGAIACVLYFFGHRR